MTNSNQLDFHEPTLQQVADLCSQFGFTCAGEADLACLRAVLREGFSRWGHQPAPPAEVDCPACEGVPKPGNQPCAVCGRSAPPAEGEVAEFIAQLKSYAEYGTPIRLIPFVVGRAATLLEQLSAQAPQPVPVSERLPGDQLCWWYEPDEDDDGSGYGGRWTLLRIRGGTATYTHWLPATALPLPAFWGGDCDKTSTSVNR